MSNKVYKWAAQQKVDSPMCKAILLALADYANDDGVTWRGQETIAKRLECSERTVRRHLLRLEQLGLIQRKHRYNSRGHRTSDLLTLLISRGVESNLPDTVSGSDRTTGHSVQPTGHSDHAYRSQSPGNHQLNLQRTLFGGKGSPMSKIYSGDKAFARWIDYWLEIGEHKLAQEARDRGWLAARSKFPPRIEPEQINAVGTR